MVHFPSPFPLPPFRACVKWYPEQYPSQKAIVAYLKEKKKRTMSHRHRLARLMSVPLNGSTVVNTTVMTPKTIMERAAYGAARLLVS